MENKFTEVQFWIETKNENGMVTITIEKSKFIEFLENRNYKKLIQNKDFQLIKVTKNSIISIVKEHTIREEIKKYLYEINKQIVWEEFLRSDYLSKKFIEGIDSITIDFNYGTQDTAVSFYNNGVLNVTADSIYLISYSDYKGYVWEDQILKRDFIPQEFSNCEFKQFCWKIAGQKKDRILPLETTIGYLLHTYKDPSFTKAIILIDENIDPENNKSEGGTGKSLIAVSIGKIIPTLKKNGKLLKTNDRFFFSDVDPHHKLVVFDDVKKDFDFEFLYSMITGDMPIEKKYKNPVVMDFKEVPKVMITSNYVVIGTGGNSEVRRKVVFEVNSHYKENLSIVKEFGHRFFDDWTKSEWLKFDNYMMFCIQQYLKNGLIEAESINENKNRLIQQTNKYFIEFMDTIIANPISNNGEIKHPKIRFNKAVIYREFIKENSELAKSLTPHSFKKWIDLYAENKKIEFFHTKNNGKNYVVFHQVIVDSKI